MIERVSRRRFLLTGSAFGITALTVACQSQEVPIPTKAPAAQPTAAKPADAAKPAEPTKPAAAAQPTTAPAPAAQPKVAAVARNETLIISVSDDLNQMPDSAIFNPFLQGSRRTGWHFAFEPLYYYNPWWTPAVSGPAWIKDAKNGEIPYLATGYEYSPDYAQLTIKIRPGVTWSDGKLFTSRDVAFTLTMLKDNAPKLNWSNDMKLWVKETAAPDDSTVKITFNMPAPRFFFEYMQWHQDAGFPIVPEHVFKGQDPLSFTNLDLERGWPVVTGPWKLVHSAPEQKIFERRDDWWGAKAGFHRLPAMKRVVVLPHFEDPKLVQLLVAGQVDATHNIQQPAEAEAALAGNPKLQVRAVDKTKPWGWLDWWPNALGFNCMKPPFDDPDIRWAINYAIDRKAIVDVGFRGDTEPTLLPFPRYQPMIAYFDGVRDLLEKYPVGTYDPAKTKQLMESKGWKKGGDNFWAKDGKKLEMVILTPPGFFQNFAPLIVSQLRDAGFDASFKSPSNSGTLQQTGELDAFLQGHAGSLNDPYQTLDHYHSRHAKPTGEAATRPYRWKNEEFDKLVDEMGRTHPSEAQKLMGLYRQAMEVWLKNLPDIPTIQWYLILPVNTAYWKGWPDSKNPYCAPSMWHRGSVALAINSLEPA